MSDKSESIKNDDKEEKVETSKFIRKMDDVKSNTENKKRPAEDETSQPVKKSKAKQETPQAETPKTEKPIAETSKTEKPIAEKPKFVFGATTPFGKAGGFGGYASMKSEKGIFNTETEKKGKNEDQHNNEVSGGKIFGSGSTFGNAFKDAVKKKSIFDESSKKETSQSNEDESSETHLDSVYRTIHLQKKDMKSGEEEESTLYQVKSKLYRMDLTKMSEGWRERGAGMLKVNQLKKPTESYKARLIMRQSGNLKLILNLPIVKNLEIFRGMTSSFSGNKFIRVQTVEEGKPIQYALKIGQVENVSLMYETIMGEIPKEKEDKESGETKSSNA
ncbi:hypothetical protein FOA43_002332 [Brettanomyces nanus]|uniref:RanBD1 domain-containing protein n=1 Tax=Eeniella nana TaxID=13502 RepID=A0A875S4K0_EENNA|nr:uncharacterized protein FOA43_002332 [Brettanomyces nanus]QPG74992.1 hypothetical protein FOA43_002332 [Brettanomyces nanus]